MMSLFLDTSSSVLIVGVIDEKNNILKSSYIEESNGDLSVKVFDVIRKCIDSADILPINIDKIYCVTGPGSFTGVRIGVTIAKTFAWSKDKKVIPISSLEVLATTKIDSTYIVPMIDARRDCVYAGIYTNNLEHVMEDAYISLDSLKNNLPKDGEIVFISNDKINYFDSVIKPNIDIMRIVELHKNDQSVNPHELNPRYLKMTEAEANLIKAKETA